MKICLGESFFLMDNIIFNDLQFARLKGLSAYLTNVKEEEKALTALKNKNYNARHN
jgi:hypothetical protein